MAKENIFFCVPYHVDESAGRFAIVPTKPSKEGIRYSRCYIINRDEEVTAVLLDESGVPFRNNPQISNDLSMEHFDNNYVPHKFESTPGVN